MISGKTAAEVRGDDPNQTFFNTTGEARETLKWPGKREGFPILLVLSEINWRELDDFTRTRLIDGVPKFEGTLSPDGRHFPGAESGGARATYDGEKGEGVGLVSADGWRVPYSGSDCVVYHEGVGHAIGLPHPEPADDSVMCFAQYNFWINQTWVTPSQKKALGWPVADDKVPPDRSGSTPISSRPSRRLFPTARRAEAGRADQAGPVMAEGRQGALGRRPCSDRRERALAQAWLGADRRRDHSLGDRPRVVRPADSGQLSCRCEPGRRAAGRNLGIFSGEAPALSPGVRMESRAARRRQRLS